MLTTGRTARFRLAPWQMPSAARRSPTAGQRARGCLAIRDRRGVLIRVIESALGMRRTKE
jgi:hypothetical protein